VVVFTGTSSLEDERSPDSFDDDLCFSVLSASLPTLVLVSAAATGLVVGLAVGVAASEGLLDATDTTREAVGTLDWDSVDDVTVTATGNADVRIFRMSPVGRCNVFTSTSFVLETASGTVALDLLGFSSPSSDD